MVPNNKKKIRTFTIGHFDNACMKFLPTIVAHPSVIHALYIFEKNISFLNVVIPICVIQKIQSSTYAKEVTKLRLIVNKYFLDSELFDY